MKYQAFNPFLPGWEYIPDGEPHVFGGRVYLYGSHDRFDGDNYCQNNYVCWSAPVNDLSDWTFHGEIFDVKSDPFNRNGEYCGYAPDCCRGPDGRYYLYYALNNHLAMSVAVSDTPAGKYTFLGHVKTRDGRVYGTEKNDAYVFDPGVLVDDDGRIHLYMGFSPTNDMAELAEYLKRWKTEGAHHIELCDDMLTMKTEPLLIAPGDKISAGTGFEGHAFFEAPSIRKYFGRYYFIYSSENYQELCYAVGNKPEGPFVFCGTLVSNGDIGIDDRSEPLNHTGNNHGSLLNINEDFYIFYHRHTNRTAYSRQACAEKIYCNEDGLFKQAEITSCGLNEKPLIAEGEYSAGIACNLSICNEYPPYITQNGCDREHSDDQYIKNMTNKAFAGFKYFDFNGGERISVKLRADDDAKGSIFELSIDLESPPIMTAEIVNNDSLEYFFDGVMPSGIYPIYLTMRGNGSCDLVSFTIHKP